ncbi:MAG: amidohydrolase family protein, partial [Gaiellaceae bacterium]|nr:amidohydrolase family protein [Gaiellaceae bacterium]
VSPRARAGPPPPPAAASWAGGAAGGPTPPLRAATAAPGGLADDGRLAGGTAPLIDCVRALHALGAPLEDALAAASAVPARVLGLRDGRSLAPRGPADLVVLSDELVVERVLVGGVEGYRR